MPNDARQSETTTQRFQRELTASSDDALLDLLSLSHTLILTEKEMLEAEINRRMDLL